jgi:ATP phosphoribosyltransferase regulatory subunit HisZ
MRTVAGRGCRWAVTALLVTLGAAGAYADLRATSPQEAAFLTENQAAMDKMMAGMDIKPTGDVDTDFAAMMIPHHQGAVAMAQAELRFGHNEQLRRIAQEIVVEQQQEIVAMRLALGQALPPLAAAPDQPAEPAAPAGLPAAGHTVHTHKDP